MAGQRPALTAQIPERLVVPTEPQEHLGHLDPVAKLFHIERGGSRVLGCGKIEVRLLDPVAFWRRRAPLEVFEEIANA